MTRHSFDHQDTAKASDELISTTHDDRGVVTLTLNQPNSRNALSQAMMRALHQSIADAGADQSVRAVILAANGPAFCAGHDLKELTTHRGDADRGRKFFEDTMNQCADLMQAIVTCPKPVIAQVHAMATAAGCQLVATCDLAVASPAARFCTPGVNIGLFCSTPMVALSRNLPRKQAMEMLMLGEVFDAETAKQYGLINKVVPDADLAEATFAFAERIAQKAGYTVAIGKEAFYRQAEMGLSEAYRFAADVMVKNMLAKDAEEGISAFLEKRQPKWTS